MKPPRPGRWFTWRELGDPPAEFEAEAIALCAAVLDPIRQAIGRPVRVTSGYRSPARNAEVGGSSTSDHPKGCAADINAAGMTAIELASLIVSTGIASRCDQVIVYPDRGHVHVSHRLAGDQRADLRTIRG